MKKYFITYGDEKFALAKNRIVSQAKAIDWFDEVTAYDSNDISQKLRESGLMSIKRGGGLWAWKPDIIHQAMNTMNDGDILVYADSGCTLQNAHEWNEIESILGQYELIAQKIYQPTIEWTRREIIEYFSDNIDGWLEAPQFCATIIIIIISPFTRSFIAEWRDIILKHPEFIKDVQPQDRDRQYPRFFENRHDQAIYSALVYKYLPSGKIYSQWERIEDYDPFRKQAIHATRLRNGEKESIKSKITGCIKRYYKLMFFRKRFHGLDL